MAGLRESGIASLLGWSNLTVGDSGFWVDRSGNCFAVVPMTGRRSDFGRSGDPGIQAGRLETRGLRPEAGGKYQELKRSLKSHAFSRFDASNLVRRPC